MTVRHEGSVPHAGCRICNYTRNNRRTVFAWWCPYVLRKRDRIIAGVKVRFLKKRFKYGFEVPESVAQAIELGDINGNMLWQDSLEK